MRPVIFGFKRHRAREMLLSRSEARHGRVNEAENHFGFGGARIRSEGLFGGGTCSWKILALEAARACSSQCRLSS